MAFLRYLGQCVFALPSLSLALLLLLPSTLSARLEQPAGTIDLTQFVSTAPEIFRGIVLDVADARGESFSAAASARFKVERGYRGAAGSEERIRYNPHHFSPGHDCIEFRPGTHWLVFANMRKGYLELVDDCYGAVGISPLMASVLQPSDILAQLEADFIAGLADPASAGRLFSIQRLGGLKSASSRPALHRVIESGDSSEKSWATYAALRTGDPAVLSTVREIFVSADHEVPPFFLAWELGQLRDRSAISGLIDIMDSAPDSNARKYAIQALGENMQAPEAAPAIGARLGDPDPGVRFYALNAMALLTHARACTLPLEPHRTNDTIEPQIRQCLVWWNESGKQRFSPK
jgi:hypothetical protein